MEADMRWCGWILAGLMVTAASAEHQVHVAAAAAPGGDGTRLAPYRTLAQARDGIRSARRDGALAIGVPVTVHVGPGVYRLEETFLLTAEDGGSATAPIAYRATEPGTVHLHGGATLEPESFRPVTDREVLARLDPAVRGKVLERDVTDVAGGGFAEFTVDQRVPSGPWLYAGRSPMTLARWPNADAPDAGWASFSAAVDKGLPMAEAEDPALRQPRPGSFVLDDPRPARWRLDDGVWLLGYWTHDWCEEAIRIASYDPHGKVIALAAPHAYGIMAGTWGQARRRFFAFNALEELDAPDEWLLDRRRNRLYIHADMLARPAPMVLSTLAQPLLKVDGARHLKFIGLTFGYAHADSIVLAHTEDIEMAGCTVANGAGHGIVVNGIGNTVRSCDLFNLGRGGIRLHGGDRRTLTPAGNLAINNHIQRFGLFQRTYAPGIGVEGCGQIVRHNRIHDAPHNAVLYGGNEHLFELNEVYRVVMETGDAGAFYTGRDWTSQGNILRHNFIHDLGGGC